MRLSALSPLLLLLLAAPALARQPAPAPAPVAPAMWEVRDADTVITLFGSVHVLPRGTRWFRPHVVQAIDAADLVVMEASVPEGAGALPVLLRFARAAPNAPPLLERVPADRRAAVAAALARLKAPPLDAYDTWYAAVLLGNIDNERRGMDPRLGVEAVLAARAQLGRKPLSYLETYEEQLAILDAVPEAEQRRMLLDAVDDLAGDEDRLRRVIDDWMAGRTERLAAEINRGFADAPTARRLLLADRNARWAKWIADRMKTPGRVFIAVGAGHLAGPDSVQAKLKPYRLTAAPVTAAPPPPAPARRR